MSTDLETRSLDETPDDDELKVGIIGGGHLGKQLARVLLQLVPIPAERLRISTRRPETLGEERSASCGRKGAWVCSLGVDEAFGEGSPCVQLSSQLASP